VRLWLVAAIELRRIESDCVPWVPEFRGIACRTIPHRKRKSFEP